MKNLLILSLVLFLGACKKIGDTVTNDNSIVIKQTNTNNDVDIDILLKARDINEFTDTGNEIGEGASTKKLYKDNASPKNEYVFSEDDKSKGFLEAYAGTVYHFLLGKHSSFTQFVFDETSDRKQIIGASLYESTYQDSWQYHIWEKKPLLAPSSGLGMIIAASILLKEVDLKGLASASSNLGIVTKNSLTYYFKIDHADSFHFDKNEDEFDLKYLKNPQSDMPYLKRLRFYTHLNYPEKTIKADFTLSKDYLDEIAQAAKYLANIPEDKIIKVLDFCEEQLNKLSDYPKNGLKGTSYKNYKDAIIDRFKELRIVISSSKK